VLCTEIPRESCMLVVNIATVCWGGVVLVEDAELRASFHQHDRSGKGFHSKR
jgi:hypothetical protein